MIETLRTSPFSRRAFIMGKDHQTGRANHPWLTGTSGWAYFTVTNFILPVFAGEGLTVDPCQLIGQNSRCRQWRGATYNITVQNPNAMASGRCLYHD